MIPYGEPIPRKCPWCKDFDGKIAKVVKLSSPVEESRPLPGGKLLHVTVTHRCELCGCGFGEGEEKDATRETG